MFSQISSFVVYGSSPVFVCCSATIGNPGELASLLVGQPVAVLDHTYVLVFS